MRGSSVACVSGVNDVTTLCVQAPNQMAHNYQDEMKSRLSSDTLTSSNPRLVCVDLLFWNFVHVSMCSLCCHEAAFMLSWCCCQTLLCLVLCCITLFLAASVLSKDWRWVFSPLLPFFFFFSFFCADPDFITPWWMMMRVVTDGAMEFHFSMRLPNRATNHTCVLFFQMLMWPRNCGTCSVGQLKRATMEMWSQPSWWARSTPSLGQESVKVKNKNDWWDSNPWCDLYS